MIRREFVETHHFRFDEIEYSNDNYFSVCTGYYAKEIEAAEDKLALIKEQTDKYNELQSSALSAARRGYVDDIIEPDATRKRLIAAFEMLFTKREDRPGRKRPAK